LSDITALQGDVIDHVNDVIALVRSALQVLPDDTESRTLTSDVKVLNEYVLRSVTSLELRLPIVATMKAGKSTLINAIAGHRLLPYRKLPMTMLPTEVVLTTRVTAPRLRVPAAVAELFNPALPELRSKARRNQAIADLAIADSAVQDTLDAINDGWTVPVTEVHGIETIRSTLSKVNDVARLAVMAGITDDSLAYLREMPRVECPPPDVLADVVGAGHADLVLVDTPGPNERGMAAYLLPMINEELQRAGIVFMVLNFIDMRSQAGEDLKREIDYAIGELGPDKLYVVVNRWDDRGPEDLDENAIKAVAAHEAGLHDDGGIDTSRVFLTSARRAFEVSSLQRQLKAYGRAAWQSAAGEALGQSVFTDAWPRIKKLPAAQLDSLLDGTPDSVWENSGFKELLGRAITGLQQQAAPLLFEAALQRCAGITERLREHLQLRRAAVSASAESLHGQLVALERDRKQVEQVRHQLGANSEERKKLEQAINEAFARRARELRDRVISDLEGNSDSGAADTGPPGSRPSALSPSGFFEATRSRFNLKPSQDIQRFDSEQQARECIDSLVQGFRKEAAAINGRLQRDVHGAVVMSEQRVGRKLRTEAKPIIEAAQRRISDTFSVAIRLSVPDFEEDAIFDLPDHKPEVHSVARTVTQRVRKRRWFTLWIIPIPVSKVVKLPDAMIYEVNIRSVAEDNIRAFDARLEQVRAGIAVEAGRGLDESLDVYFASLDLFLVRYKASLQGGLEAARLDHDKQTHLVDCFTAILSRAGELADDRSRLLEYAGQSKPSPLGG
jgi:hypothetical protein